MTFGERRRTMAFDFIVVIMAILAGGQLVLGVWFLFDQRALHMEIMHDRARLTAGFHSKEFGEAIQKGDLNAIKTHAETISRDGDVISMKVLDESGRAFVRLDFSDGRDLKGGWNPFFVPWENTVREPVFNEGRQVGTLEMLYSGRSANEAMLSLMIRPVVVQSIIFVLVSFGVYLFFQKRVGGPIYLIRDLMKKVTEGDLSVEVPDMGEEEIGVIASGLRYIVQRLSLTVGRLNATSEKVALTIRGLEGTFDELTERIKRQTASTGDIVKALQSAGEFQRKITEITDDLSTSSSDNVAALLEIKAMADEIVTSMEMLHNASESSYSTVTEMAQTSKAMSENSNSILVSVETTAASVEEIIASVREVERSAKESSRLADNVREEAAQKGVTNVADAVDGMKEITRRVEYSMDMVRRLHQRSNDVAKILDVIHEVNEQTNLLSLNAAILAEKAGEYGKGFSVVAGEMRALSNRTSSSTKDIAGIIKTIQEEIREVVGSIEEGTEMVRDGSEKVYRVGVTMSDILEAAYNSALMTMTIEKATEEQVKALEHVESSMIDISGKASQMARTMEEQISGSRYMQERVGEVREIAESTKKGTDEQAAGTTAISRSFENSRESAEMINQSVFRQKQTNDDILEAVEKIKNAGVENLIRIQDVSESLNMLVKEIDTLRSEMGAFRLR